MDKSIDFEKKIRRIEEIIEILDSGEKPLEELLEIYEEGMRLTSESKDFLNKVEVKIVDISKNYNQE